MIMSDSSLATTQNPWPGLNSFTESQQSLFRGRRSETDQASSPRQTPLAKCFVWSIGIGKDVVGAGRVVSRVRHEGMLPITVRLDYDAKAPPLAEQVLGADCVVPVKRPMA